MRNSIILIFGIFLLQGCSQLLWMKYLEPTSSDQWYESGGTIPERRSVSFRQPGYAYQRDSLTVGICPEVLDDFLISMGPPFVPLIPFIPQYIMRAERKLVLQVTLTDFSEKSLYDLRGIAVVLDRTQRIPPVQCEIEQIDSLRHISWKRVNTFSRDSLGFNLKISANRTRVRYMFDVVPSEYDSLVILIKGIRTINNEFFQIPDLKLIRKGRFLYESVSSA